MPESPANAWNLQGTIAVSYGVWTLIGDFRKRTAALTWSVSRFRLRAIFPPGSAGWWDHLLPAFRANHSPSHLPLHAAPNSSESRRATQSSTAANARRLSSRGKYLRARYCRAAPDCWRMTESSPHVHRG